MLRFFKTISDSMEITPNSPRAISVRVLIPKPCINLMQNLSRPFELNGPSSMDSQIIF